MSDQVEEGGAQAPKGSNGALSLGERAELEKLAIFARREMVTDDKIDPWKVADEIEPTILQAVVEAERDRSKVGVSPTRFMDIHFPEVQKRSDVEVEDPDVLDLVDAVYSRCKNEVFRVLSIMPNGPIQSRLANNGDGYVLCRMKGRKGAEEVAYITRNKKCIDADNNGPAYHAVNLAIAKAAALTGMSIERIQEHGKWFRGQYTARLAEGLTAGKNTVQAALDGPTEDGDE